MSMVIPPNWSPEPCITGWDIAKNEPKSTWKIIYDLDWKPCITGRDTAKNEPTTYLKNHLRFRLQTLYSWMRNIQKWAKIYLKTAEKQLICYVHRAAKLAQYWSKTSKPCDKVLVRAFSISAHELWVDENSRKSHVCHTRLLMQADWANNCDHPTQSCDMSKLKSAKKGLEKVIHSTPLNLWICAGSAQPGPPLGPQLGQVW